MTTDATNDARSPDAEDAAAAHHRRYEKRLNDLVAITVVILSVFMAVTKIKDDNIVQAMQLAKADAVDSWAEYQATRIKLHTDENSLAQLQALNGGVTLDRDLTAKQIAAHQSDIKKYNDRSRETMEKAKSLEAQYNALNFRDDQFDMSDAFLSIALAVVAVSALVDSFPLLYFGWVAAALGLAFGISGFAGFNFRPDWLAAFLGT
jgi:hypothetical protein